MREAQGIVRRTSGSAIINSAPAKAVAADPGRLRRRMSIGTSFLNVVASVKP